jgi:predicted dehydrogenase
MARPRSRTSTTAGDTAPRAAKRLGIGIIGSGFNAQFHLRSFTGVRDADVRGIWSPSAKHASEAAQIARRLDVGPAKPFRSIAAMVADPAIDAIWLCGPNFSRIENVEEITDTITRGRGRLAGIACEKPLARTVAEATRVTALVKRCGLNHGYLENQVFAPQVELGRDLVWARGARLTGRPYLARAAEEHSGPHRPWFWQGRLQGGGVLNDMMCHSALLVRHLLTEPGAARDALRPARITAHIASLKWSRPEYVARLKREMGPEVDYSVSPAEDFASMTVEFVDADGRPAIGEATTSWSYVGAGLRLSAEVLGPEYSMSWNTLDSGLKLFFSRRVKGDAGEDLVEKQNAETGLMPVVAGEAAAYGYEAENRHFVRAFLRGEPGALTFDDGVEVVKILMAAYMSAEQGKTLAFPPPGLAKFVPQVATGTWKG